MVLEQPWGQKRMFSAFKKSIFQFLASFWVTKFKLFSGKLRQSVKNYLNQNLGKTPFSENGFGATNLELKNEPSECLKRAFFSFLQIFELRSWNPSLEKCGKAFKTIQI